MDKKEYYGGTEAALSLQEIEAWVEKVNDGRPAKERSVLAANDSQQRDHHPSEMLFSRKRILRLAWASQELTASRCLLS